jgi:hypothetical protein
MRYNQVKFTREQLYKEVWNKPMASLAKEYGLSDTGLRKICKHLQIPLPPQGYFLRKRRGPAPPLPPVTKGTPLFHVSFHCHPPAHLQDAVAEVPLIPELAFEDDPANRVTVPPALELPHPLIRKSEQSLRKAKPDDDGRLSAQYRDGLHITVYPESVDRALLVMDTIIKAIINRGFAIAIDPGNRATIMTILDEVIEVCLEERGQRIDYEPTPKELKKSERLKYRTYPLYKYISSGRLVIKAKTRIDPWELVSSDKKKSRVEMYLNEVIARLVKYALSVRERRLRREQEERERREREEHRQEMRRLIELEKVKLKELNDEVDTWHKSQRIRKYLAAARQSAIEQHGKINPGSEMDEWLIWAEKQADRLDPLVESPYSVLDDEAKFRYW